MLPIFKFALRDDLKDNKEFLPTRANPKASGWDVRAAFNDRQSLIVKPFDHILIPLGFRAMVPDGFWYELKPRSSTFAKKYLHTLIGTIDVDFENQLLLAGQYIPQSIDQRLEIKFGEAIGQIIPIKLQEMEVIEVTNNEIDADFKTRAGVRGKGGFGSSG